jgi:hypothetical protein
MTCNCTSTSCPCDTIKVTATNAECRDTQNSAEFTCEFAEEEKVMVREEMPTDANDRNDDEGQEEFFDDLIKLNAKESFDIHRGDDRHNFRVVQSEWLHERKGERERLATDAEQARRHAEEMFAQRMRHTEELHAMTMAHLSNANQVTNRDQLQSTAHRDLAVAQEWRDQARDSGESVFKPEQSS